MSGNTIRRMDPEADPDAGAYISVEQDFARRLHHYMTQRGWTQSDLAREVWGERMNSRGYKEAKGRDRISVFLKGNTMPETTTLEALAKALDVTPEDLCPEQHRKAMAWEPHAISLTVAPGHTNKARLVIDRIVPFAVGAEIIAILAKHGLAD